MMTTIYCSVQGTIFGLLLQERTEVYKSPFGDVNMCMYTPVYILYTCHTV